MRLTWPSLTGIAALGCSFAIATPVLAQTVARTPESSITVYDPWEGANRGLFRLNTGLDRAIIRPAAMGYQAVLPKPVRAGVRNVLNNIDEPNTFLNDVLQGRLKQGGGTAVRFTVNTTVGVLGIFDVARRMGVEKHFSDFGQTLGRWGVPPGPYVYVPVIGPSDLRDGTGRIVDAFTGLLSLHDLHVTPDQRLGVAAIDGLDTRVALDSTLEDVNRTATDPYATQRSAYLQNRRSVIIGAAQAIDQLPSFEAPPPADAPASPPKP